MKQSLGTLNRVDSVELVNIKDIKVNKENRNRHSDEQIDRLCAIIEYQGFRDPLIVSNLSGLLVSGHGRLEAAHRLGIKAVPVTYQDFDSEEQEYAAMVSLNSISQWSELDLSAINADLARIGPIDIDMLGIKGFVVDMAEKASQAAQDAMAPKSRAGGEKASFEGTDEQTEVAGRKYVIIIDAGTQEAKDALKERIGPIVEEAGARIF